MIGGPRLGVGSRLAEGVKCRARVQSLHNVLPGWDICVWRLGGEVPDSDN